MTAEDRSSRQPVPSDDQQYLGQEIPELVGRWNEWTGYIGGNPLIIEKAVDVTDLFGLRGRQSARLFYHEGTSLVLLLRQLRDMMPAYAPAIFDLSNETFSPEDDGIGLVSRTTGVSPQMIHQIILANAPQAPDTQVPNSASQ